MVSSAMPSSSSRSSSWPTFLSWSIIVSWYGDCQRPAWPRLSGFVCVRKCMCVVFTQQKNGLPPVVLALDEVGRGGDELVVAGLHPLAGERAGVLDPLLADSAPARLRARVVLVRGTAMQHAAGTEALLELGKSLLG